MPKRPLTVALAALALVGCVEPPFARDNALDLTSNATLTFTTVDTAFSRFEEVVFVPQITGARLPPDTPPVDFRAEGPNATVFQSNSVSSFRVSEQASVIPVVVPVRANLLDRLSATRTVVVMQRLRTIGIVCTPAPCTLTGPGATREVNISMTDSLGWPLNIPLSVSSTYATALPRDTLVVRASGPVPGRLTLTAVGAGQTYLVVGNSIRRDSIVVTVSPP